LAANKNIDLIVFVNPDLPDRVKGDPMRIRQILFNLIGNAIKFSAAEDGSLREVTIRADAGKERTDGKANVRFTVADSGVGISAEHMARVFTPFFQSEAATVRRYGGTGLGLSICKNLVGLMGGEIGVTSEPAKGATFTFELSFEVASSALGADDRVDLSGLRVLLAFDDSLSRHTVQSYLGHSGASVSVSDGISGSARASGSGEAGDSVPCRNIFPHRAANHRRKKQGHCRTSERPAVIGNGLRDSERGAAARESCCPEQQRAAAE